MKTKETLIVFLLKTGNTSSVIESVLSSQDFFQMNKNDHLVKIKVIDQHRKLLFGWDLTKHVSLPK